MIASATAASILKGTATEADFQEVPRGDVEIFPTNCDKPKDCSVTPATRPSGTEVESNAEEGMSVAIIRDQANQDQGCERA